MTGAGETEFPFDYVVGFPNSHGGVNAYAVKKNEDQRQTDRRLGDIAAEKDDLIANSNLPVPFPAVDAERNRVYYARPGSHAGKNGHPATSVEVPCSRSTKSPK